MISLVVCSSRYRLDLTWSKIRLRAIVIAFINNSFAAPYYPAVTAITLKKVA